MAYASTWGLLASASEVELYVNPIKILVVVVLLFGWAFAAQWIDRDTDTVKTKREQWNLIVLSGAAVGFLVLFVGPWSGGLFLGGVVAWLMIAGGAMFAYILHRNSRVVPAGRVLTMGHAKRLFSSGGEKKTSDKGIRVKLQDQKGNQLPPPTDTESGRVYDMVQDFLYELLWRRASDAELTIEKDRYRLQYRIDGVAAENTEGLPLEDGEKIIKFLKTAAGLNVEEIRRPQTGKIKAALLAHTGDIGHTEVQTSGTTAGEKLRLRIGAGTTLLRLTELGIAPPRLEALKKDILAKHTGLFLLSAPPQSGLTTTQYAILRSHDAYMHNIHTIERRKLLDLDNVTQQVYEGTNTDVNFARMLQSILRREPDIVMVGECEDRETAQIATRAAADDRKIYMGIRAKDSFDALQKYLTYVEDNKLAAKALRGVISQRLTRILCDQCREAFKPDEATLKKLNLPVDKIEKFYRPPSEQKLDRKGKPIVCLKCQGTGYVGRTGVFELLVVTDDVAKLITEGASIERIKAECRKSKMYYLQEEGLLKVIDGTTSMTEVLRCLKVSDK